MEKIILNLYTIIFLFLTVGIYGQLQNANWYFGDHAGLTFNTTPPTVLTDGQTGYQGSKTVTVSDTNGELLFYTDGVSVWNKNHDYMENGNNTLLGSSGTVAVIPFPNDEYRYYIFYDGWGTSSTYSFDGLYVNSGANKFGYSVVNLQSGLGEVETLNVDLGVIPYEKIIDETHVEWFIHAERTHLAVTTHSDGNSYWLIYNPFKYFFVFEITESGISDPIISDANGTYYEGYQYETFIGGGTKMSISPNGQKIAYNSSDFTPGSDSGGVTLYLFNFDNSSGEITYNYSEYLSFSDRYTFYKASTVEFSPNSKYLYEFGNCFNCTGEESNSIVQYYVNDMTSFPEVIFAEISYDTELWMYSVTSSLGIDGKIYIPGPNSYNYNYTTNKLSVINTPNEFGIASNFVKDQVDLGTNTSSNLPQQIPVHEISCPNDLYIDEDVQLGEFDFQSASNSITAVNTIYSGATAEYNAGNFVLLDVGFYAQEDSDFYAYIEGCEPRDEKGDIKTTSNFSNKFDANSNNLELQLVIYPNPNNGLFIIDFPFKENQNYRIEIYDSNFQIRANKNVNKLNNKIDISNLTDGFYYLKLFTDDGVFTKHFLIEN